MTSDYDEPEDAAAAAAWWRSNRPTVTGPGAPPRGVVPTTSTALLGALAMGALAIGAIAIGALAIGRLSIGKVRLREVEIGNLVVRRVSGLSSG
jgi:hypothetical protein